VSAGKRRIGPSEKCATHVGCDSRAEPCGPVRTSRAAPDAPGRSQGSSRPKPGPAFRWRSRSCGFPRRSSAGFGSIGLRRSLPAVSRFRCGSKVFRPMHAGSFPSQHPPPRLHVAFGAPDMERDHPQPVIRANADQQTTHGPVSLGLDPSKSPPPACPRRSTPGTVPEAATRVRDNRQCAFGPWLPSHSVLFRPRGFSPPRRLSPHRGVRACCVPVPDMGFAAFLVHQATETEVSRRVAGRLRSRRRGSRPGSSQRRPFEGLILVGSRSASLRSLPPRRLVRPFRTPRGRRLQNPTANGGETRRERRIRVGGGSDGPPADAASRPFPPGAVWW
jgi:hypothetical protein